MAGLYSNFKGGLKDFTLKTEHLPEQVAQLESEVDRLNGSLKDRDRELLESRETQIALEKEPFAVNELREISTRDSESIKKL